MKQRSSASAALSPQETFFNNTSVTDEQRDLLKGVDFVLEENLPLSSIEKQSFRIFSRTTHNFGSKRSKRTLYHLIGIATKKISLEMSKAKQGAAARSGWTFPGAHCVGLFGCCLILKKM